MIFSMYDILQEGIQCVKNLQQCTQTFDQNLQGKFTKGKVSQIVPGGNEKTINAVRNVAMYECGRSAEESAPVLTGW